MTMTVVVTGASSGIGRAFAERLAERGCDVVLVARREDRLVALADRLTAAHGVTATIAPCDLADVDAIDRLVASLDRPGLRIDGLVNCAGVGTAGPFAREDPEALARELAVNVVAPTLLTRMLMPQLLASPAGLLLMVSSTASHQPVPHLATYAASKAYLTSLTAALWRETKGSGLTVLALCPGPTATEFFEVAGSDRFKVGRMVDVDTVVAAALRAVDRRRGPVVTLGWGNRIQALGGRLAPLRLTLEVGHRATTQDGD